jgi:calcineurin-like phosphoesterase family protein
MSVPSNYFMADLHLGHANVIKFDKRPFKDVNEMNSTLLRNIEETLKEGDNFYYLGDFSFISDTMSRVFMRRIAATKAHLFFIRGNHDKKDIIKLYQEYGTYLGEQKTVTVNDQVIVLNHYRMDVWDRSHYGSWHLHGHSHQMLPPRPHKVIDVGCMGYNYFPVEFAEIKRIMDGREKMKHHE